MVGRVNLDIDALRTFVAGMEAGSFAKAAERVGRSPAAVSQHLRKLERQFGAVLTEKRGRHLVLTPAGETVLAYARRLLAMNDEAVAAVRQGGLAGTVRLGLVQDFAEGVLPAVLGRFARAHPDVVLEAVVGGGQALLGDLQGGRLDLVLVWGEPAVADREWLGGASMQWMASADRDGDPWDGSGDRPLPLVLLQAPCRFREAGCAALDAAGIPWRVAFASPSLGAAWAAVAAGVGVTPRLRLGAPAGLAPHARLNDAAPLPPVAAWLASSGSPDRPATELRADIADRVEAALAAGR
ncbi:LysR substrate-binding domain-containing protein [Novispirillum sp. DQ9]|uniref:LysR substrate-binding domain-containing protein n=1 Tax=Novispirillum sp. DQ9 TaxID=3398612 RepID=UPI003C79F7C4